MKGQALVDEVRGCSGSWTYVKTGAFTPGQTPGLQPWSDLVHGVFQQVTSAAWRTDPGEHWWAREAWARPAGGLGEGAGALGTRPPACSWAPSSHTYPRPGEKDGARLFPQAPPPDMADIASLTRGGFLTGPLVGGAQGRPMAERDRNASW